MPKAYTKANGSSRGKTQYIPDSEKYLFNIDTFWFNVDATNYEVVMSEGFDSFLRSAREHKMDTDENLTFNVDVFGYENPVVFEVHGGQPPLYQYSIRNKDIAIYFCRTRREKQLPMKVQINQFILWEKGVVGAYVEALTVLESLGFAHSASRLNRIDFAVHSDQWKWNLKDLTKMDYPRNFADDNKPNFFRLDPSTGEFETVYYGTKAHCQLRIYNKSKEAKKKGKQYFLDLYEEKGMDIDNVWNVEIQVGRDFIKDCKDLEGLGLFDNLEQVFEEGRLSDLWTYLMQMFTHNSAHWKLLAQGKKDVFEKREGFLTRQRDNEVNAYAEFKQVVGRMKALLLNENSDTIEDAVLKVLEMNEQYEKETGKSFEKLMKKKRMSYMNDEMNKRVQIDKDDFKDDSLREKARSYVLSPKKIGEKSSLSKWLKKELEKDASK